MSRIQIFKIILGVCVALGPQIAQAQVPTLAFPTERGWVCDQVNYPCAVYGQPGVVMANNGASPQNNVFAGSGLIPNDVGQTFNAGIYRNWFQFSIPKLTGPLVSAVLTLPEPNRWNAQDLTYTVYGLPGQPATFADIHGIAYGTVTTHASDFGKIVYLKFNALGMAAIEGSQGGTLFIGGIDSGEAMGSYHGDFSGTGFTDSPPNPTVDRRTPLTLTVGSPTATASVDATCAGAPAGLNSFVVEHPIDLTKAILSSLTPNVPAAFAPVFAGTKVARDRIVYDSTTKIMTNDVFLVDPTAPYPTPPTYDVVANRLIYVIVAVDKVTMSCRPRPVVQVSGTAADGFPIFGDPSGAPVTFSFGYTMDSPARLRDVVNLVGGVAVVYEPSVAYSTVAFSPVSAAIAGVPMIVTNTPIVSLDGSASTGGPLVYSWSSNSYGLAFISPATATTQVYVGAGYGDYQATLTVTNVALGESATANVTIRYQAGS